MRTPETSPMLSDEWRGLAKVRWEPVANSSSSAIAPFSPFVVVNMTDGAEGGGRILIVRPPNDPVPTLASNEASRAVGFAGPAGIPAKSGSTLGKGIGTLQTPCCGRVSGSWESSGSVDEEDIIPQVLYVTSASQYLTTSNSGTVYGRYWPLGQLRDVGSSVYDVMVFGNPVATVENSPENTGACACTVVTGVVGPLEAGIFGTQKSAYRWTLTGISDALEALGFDVSDLTMVYDITSEAWFVELVRTCDSVTSDDYTLMLEQDATKKWIVTLELTGGTGSPNCDTELIWHFAADGAVRWDRTQPMALDTGTKYAKDGDYEDPPANCVFCLEPVATPGIQCSTVSGATDNDELIEYPADVLVVGMASGDFSLPFIGSKEDPGPPALGLCVYGDSSGTSGSDWMLDVGDCGGNTISARVRSIVYNTLPGYDYTFSLRLNDGTDNVYYGISFTDYDDMKEQIEVTGVFTVTYASGTSGNICGSAAPGTLEVRCIR